MRILDGKDLRISHDGEAKKIPGSAVPSVERERLNRIEVKANCLSMPNLTGISKTVLPQSPDDRQELRRSVTHLSNINFKDSLQKHGHLILNQKKEQVRCKNIILQPPSAHRKLRPMTAGKPNTRYR